MTAYLPRGRSGITLTEILISILIMGVGLVSLATLFPLGLLRLREANRASRSALFAQSASNEVTARNLLDRFTFRSSWYTAYDPWIQDTPLNAAAPINGGVYRGSGSYGAGIAPFIDGPGLPVAYDPLFWSTVHYNTFGDATPIRPDTAEFRFGSGLGFIRPDPDGKAPSAHGLQRITNFAPLANWPFTYPTPGAPALTDVAGDVFASREDIVFQEAGTDPQSGTGSPLLPAMDPTTFSYQVDYAYTWMFTGQQTDATDYTVFDGAIVIFNNRGFAAETTTTPSGATVPSVPGEQVVEAVWGYSASVDAYGYGRGDKTVLLRWDAQIPDPNVPVGSWIADVTYERSASLNQSRFNTPLAAGDVLYPGQRCYWYQVVRRGTVEVDPTVAGHRRMVVTLNSPVRAKTRIAPASAAHVNVALIAPSVVNAFPKVFFSH